MRLTKALAIVLIVFQFFGCSLAPTPELVYQDDEPDLNASSDQPLGDLGVGDHAIVVLANGERFEATYRGYSKGTLAFEAVEWGAPLDREPVSTFRCALDEVAGR